MEKVREGLLMRMFDIIGSEELISAVPNRGKSGTRRAFNTERRYRINSTVPRFVMQLVWLQNVDFTRIFANMDIKVSKSQINRGVQLCSSLNLRANPAHNSQTTSERARAPQLHPPITSHVWQRIK